MNLESLRSALSIFDQLEATTVSDTDTSPLVGKYVIVRSRDSGVHAGFLARHQGCHISLTDSRRLWYWKAAKEHTLSAVSLFGLSGGSKISSAVGRIEILDACEIIPCTPTSQDSIQGITSHDPR
ncbi:MAG: DUF6948 domain-containing protein [Pikeienuella sp.]